MLSFIECVRKYISSISSLPNNNYGYPVECSNSDIQQCWNEKTFKKQADSSDNIHHGPILLHTHEYSSITSFIFTSCEWISCEGGTGGGIYTTKAGSTLKVISCYFDDCSTSTDFGGGIAAEHLGTVYISSSSFITCHGQNIHEYNSGGGVVFLDDTQQCHQIHDCSFIGCYSGADGGAVHLRYSKLTQKDDIVNTRFIDCKTLYDVFGVEGGALQSYDVTVTCALSNSIITGCHSYNGGGLYLEVKENSHTNIISFCFFNSNTASGRGNDVGLYYFSREMNDEFILYSFSGTESNRLEYYYINNWCQTSIDWLPLEMTNYLTYSFR